MCVPYNPAKKLTRTVKQQQEMESELRVVLFAEGSKTWSSCLHWVSIVFHSQRRQWHPTPVLLPGKSHGWRSLVGCSPWGRQESDTTTSLSFFTFMRWRRKRQPTPVFLPGESQGRRSLVGCRLWGCTESDTTEVTQQQQQQQQQSFTNFTTGCGIIKRHIKNSGRFRHVFLLH